MCKKLLLKGLTWVNISREHSYMCVCECVSLAVFTLPADVCVCVGHLCSRPS